MILRLPRTDSAFILNIIADILPGRSVFIRQRMFNDKRCYAFHGTWTVVPGFISLR